MSLQIVFTASNSLRLRVVRNQWIRTTRWVQQESSKCNLIYRRQPALFATRTRPKLNRPHCSKQGFLNFKNLVIHSKFKLLNSSSQNRNLSRNADRWLHLEDIIPHVACWNLPGPYRLRSPIHLQVGFCMNLLDLAVTVWSCHGYSKLKLASLYLLNLKFWFKIKILSFSFYKKSSKILS